jgi:cobyrinic acid a,c-diamide synthase
MNTFLLAGTQSGCGKTSVMLALLQAIQYAGLTVAPFKTGPDFLDPLWHQVVTGRASYNVDTQMIGLENSRYQLQQHARDVDYALIEGVMGLFDGRSGVGEAGSSLDLARKLSVPVLLVVDVRGMSGSVVPLVQGFCSAAQAKGVTIAGIIANRVGSLHHAELIKNLLAEHGQPPLLAWLEKTAPSLPERHLGLVLPDSVPDFLPFFHLTVDLRDWGGLCASQPCWGSCLTPTYVGLLRGKKIAVSRDAACCFIYPANLDWLRAEGAELQFFSPLAGDCVPLECDAVWLVGGYPELYTETLSQSVTWVSLRDFIESGKPVLAECGGMMILGQELIELDGTVWTMAGILPYSIKMQPRLVSLGYRNVAELRGHEFHYSERIAAEPLPSCFALERGDQGVAYKNLRASYIHWYFPSQPETVANWFKGEK